MSEIGIILNPHSRSNRRNPGRAHRLGFIVGDKGSCHITDEISQVEELAHTFKAREIEILAISGGDGTYHHTLGTFIRVYGETPLPKICFLRGGTINLLAGNLGIRGTPESILTRLIYQYHQQAEPFQTVSLFPMRINGGYGFIFSVGMIHNLVQAHYRGESLTFRQGMFIVAKVIAHFLCNSRWAGRICRRLDAQVVVDGEKWPFQNYSEVFAAAVRQAGFGFQPFPELKKGEDRFGILSFSTTPRRFILRLPWIMLGIPFQTADFLRVTAQTLQIDFAEPHGYFVDGELYAPVRRLEVSVGPKLEVVVP